MTPFSFLTICLVLRAVTAIDERQSIVGGMYAKPGEFKYHAAIKSPQGIYKCGAALISVRHALTAGHCIKSKQGHLPTNAYLTVGTNNLYQGGDNYAIEKAIVHPSYTQKLSELHYDIGVLKLASKVRLTPYVSIARLPTRDVSNGEYALISAFGSENTNTGYRMSFTLKKLMMKTVDINVCNKYYSTYHMSITSTQFCAISGSKSGMCSGDSGSPIVSSDNYLIGIASYVVPCAVGYPDVFTKVYSNLDFIRQSMTRH